MAHGLKHKWRTTSDGSEDFKIGADVLISYDIACAYSVHAHKRFSDNHPECSDVIGNARFLIPLVHVRNHKDNCEYRHSCRYTTSAGHFHGETCEQTWAESNQLGPQTRQMNNGHRQDTIIDHHSDWNWRKAVNIGSFSADILPNALQLTFRQVRFF